MAQHVPDGVLTGGDCARTGDVFGRMNRSWPFSTAALVLGLLIDLASLTIIGGILLAVIPRRRRRRRLLPLAAGKGHQLETA